MINMIRAEKYRLTKTKGFYIFWGLILLVVILDRRYRLGSRDRHGRNADLYKRHHVFDG